MPSQCRSDSIMFSLLSQNVCDLLWISSQYWCDSAAVSCPQNVCYLVWSLENVDLTLRLLHSRRAYVILFNDCTMMMWLYTAPTERMFSCLIWSLDNVDLTLPQGVCYIVWSLNNVDLTPSLPVHHLSHRKYVTTFDPWTKLIFIIAPTACMLYCSIPAQCRSYSTIFSSLKQGVCYIV